MGNSKSLRKLCLLLMLCACGRAQVSPAPEEPFSLAPASLQVSTGRIYGYDVMALATYCDTYLKAPHLPYVSTLLNTFGDPIPCLDRAVNIHGLTDVEFDLVDYTCYRNHTCPPGTPALGDRKTVRERAARVENFRRKHPELTVWISWGLEYDIKDAATVRGLLAAAAAGCPDCLLIQSPYSGLTLPEYKVELHGNTKKAFAVSNDGSSLFDGDSGAYRLHGSHLVAAWFNELNDRFSGEKTFTPPKLRKCRPTLELFKQAYLALKEPQPQVAFPRSCQIRRDVTAPEILKTNAESYCTGKDPRENKPLFITKISGRKGDRISVVSSADRVIGAFAYYDTYTTPGFYRWYLGTGSGQDPVGLFRAAGNSEWAFIKRKNGSRIECIRFNTIRREGSFR